jgi:G:T-mismatch repair DNA endonuclease (very short patch repair protein)
MGDLCAWLFLAWPSRVCKGYTTKRNRDYWSEKLASNQRRDAEKTNQLQKAGFEVGVRCAFACRPNDVFSHGQFAVEMAKKFKAISKLPVISLP